MAAKTLDFGHQNIMFFTVYHCHLGRPLAGLYYHDYDSFVFVNSDLIRHKTDTLLAFSEIVGETNIVAETPDFCHQNKLKYHVLLWSIRGAYNQQ